MSNQALTQAAEALRLEWVDMERFVSPILFPDQTNPEGPKVIDAYRISSGAWLMLQARIRHVIAALSYVSPEEVSVLVQTYRTELEKARPAP